jgi:hypothetical protein
MQFPLSGGIMKNKELAFNLEKMIYTFLDAFITKTKLQALML